MGGFVVHYTKQCPQPEQENIQQTSAQNVVAKELYLIGNNAQKEDRVIEALAYWKKALDYDPHHKLAKLKLEAHLGTMKSIVVGAVGVDDQINCELLSDRVRLWEKDSTKIVYELTLSELDVTAHSFHEIFFSPDSTKMLLTFLVSERGYLNTLPYVVVVDVKKRKLLRTYHLFEAWIDNIHPTNKGFYAYARFAKFGASHDVFYAYDSDEILYSQETLNSFDILYSSDTGLIFYNDLKFINALENSDGSSEDSEYVYSGFMDNISLFDTQKGTYLWNFQVDSLFTISRKNYLYTTAEFVSDTVLLIAQYNTNSTGDTLAQQRLYDVHSHKWSTIPTISDAILTQLGYTKLLRNLPWNRKEESFFYENEDSDTSYIDTTWEQIVSNSQEHSFRRFKRKQIEPKYSFIHIKPKSEIRYDDTIVSFLDTSMVCTDKLWWSSYNFYAYNPVRVKKDTTLKPSFVPKHDINFYTNHASKKYVAITNHTNQTTIWNYADSTKVISVDSSPMPVSSIAFNEEGNILYIAYVDVNNRPILKAIDVSFMQNFESSTLINKLQHYTGYELDSVYQLKEMDF